MSRRASTYLYLYNDDTSHLCSSRVALLSRQPRSGTTHRFHGRTDGLMTRCTSTRIQQVSEMERFFKRQEVTRWELSAVLM